MSSAAATLDVVADLYHRGQFLQAYAASEPLGPLEHWQGTEARIWAGRLANMLGSPRLGRVLHALAWRADPDNCRAKYYHALNLLYDPGPLAAWKHMRSVGAMSDALVDVRADWCALEGCVAAVFRDFEKADRCIAEALQLAPDRPWIHVEQAMVLDLEDRYEEALDAARRSLDLQPSSVAAIQATAHELVQVNRDEEALDLLRDAAGRLESGSLMANLAVLETELGHYAEARAHLARVGLLLPLLSREKKRQQSLIAQQADAAYYCGDNDEAVRLASTLEDEFHQRFAERLRAGPQAHRRVMLPVGFVRQHHVTCAPATLTALSLYWSRPADHLDVAEEICYDGTPVHSQRQWADDNDFATAEFRITWDSAVELIDRGLPFTLSTVVTGAGHLQAVIGYDSCRGSLLVRDPSERRFTEMDADKAFETFRSTGPRGMVMVPRERAGLLDGLSLPDVEYYDKHYRIDRALRAHDRATAGEIHKQMLILDPDHPLTLRARGTLANYDADVVAMLRNADELLQLYPDDGNLLAYKLNCLMELGRRDDRIAMLEQSCRKTNVDPYFFGRYAAELAQDARNADESEWWARRALRHRPIDGACFQILADLYWTRGRRSEALSLYRIAACLDDKDENRNRAYFVASRFCGETDTALQLLEDRFSRLGRLSGSPGLTLSWGHDELGQTHEAFRVLDEALQLRPDDGDLLLFAADLHGRFGRHENALALLDRAEKTSHRNQWLRTAASLDMNQSNLAGALERWRQIVKAEPLARDANENVARLLADLEGPNAAEEFVGQAARRFPHSYTLQVLLIERLGAEKPVEAEAAVRRLLEGHPVDPWARRELALALLRQQKGDEALLEANLAAQLEPNHPTAYMIRGQALEGLGSVAEARRAYRQAIHVSVDYEPAINYLMGTCDGFTERREQLKFVYEELTRQVSTGDGLLSYRDHASGVVEPEELLATLLQALQQRPDMWHAHAAVVQQLLQLGRADEALAGAQVLVERFPLVPRVWIEMAEVHSAKGDSQSAVASLRRALEISPGWSMAVHQLAETLNDRGDLAEAKDLLEQAVVREPRNPQSRAMLAVSLWNLGKQDEAVRNMAQALRIEPGYRWPWSRLREWAMELGRPELALDPARRLAETRPLEARSWLMLAQTLQHFSLWDEALKAADRTIALNPRLVEAHGIRVDCLTELGNLDDALAACRPDALGDEPPPELRARAADIQARGGAIDTAISEMKIVVQENPGYAWAWSRLADWYGTTNRQAEYLHACEQLVRIAPHMPVCWACRADARRSVGDRAGALADYSRALELDPGYLYAGNILLDMKVEDDDVPGAADILAVLEPRLSPDMATAQRARLDALANDQDAFLDKISELCRTAKEPSTLKLAVDCAGEKPWRSRVEALLAGQMEQPGVSRPVVATVWVQICARFDQGAPQYAFETVAEHPLAHCSRRLEVMACSEETWIALSRQLLIEMQSAGAARLLDGFVREHRERLRNDNRTWGTVGNVLLHSGRIPDTARWMDDWKSREGLEASMLFPLAYSLRVLRRSRESAEVARRAVELPPDDSTGKHQVWVALDEFLNGDGAAAAARLQQVDRQALNNEYHQDLHRIVAAAAAINKDTESCSQGCARLKDEWNELPKGHQVDAVILRVYRLCRWRVALNYNRRLAAWFWRWRAG